ncbi:MAG: choice-of-anchor J domain-containing protein [Proteobacteria bacterium]|nr:choice-of-anchor J domain-containing protein [Pseudomonadota bacterium]MBU1455211.1 choice-of-anchor J domain-containing protein [Pseudomonadota bacterium]
MRRFCMTHFIVFVFILGAVQFSQAATVLLSEGFDDVYSLPAGWEQINNSEPLGSTDWFQGDDTLFVAQAGASDTSYVAADFNNTTAVDVGGTISNWLLTPVIDFAAVQSITFYTRTADPNSTGTVVFADHLEVRYSSSGTSTNVGTAATDVGAFNSAILVDVNPALTLDDYPVDWTQYTITSNDLPASGTGRIAFRYFVPDAGDPAGTNGNYIGIDTVEVLSKDYTITASAGVNGSITPSGAVTVDIGASQAFTFTPDGGYHVSDVLVDGVSVGRVPDYTFTNVTAAHTIHVDFSSDYIITASAGVNGMISPIGAVTVADGLSQSFTMTPDTHYHVADVLVDGVSVGAVTSYDFTNVTAYHTIYVIFAIDAFDITATAGSNGSISPAGTVAVGYGSDYGFDITANAGYHIADVLVDSVSVGAVPSDAFAYVFQDVMTAHTISASFAINTYTVTPIAQAHGSMTPSAPQTVNNNATTAFTVNPDTGYHIDTVSGCGGSLTGSTYTTGPVTADCSVTAAFAIDSFSLDVTVTGKGSVTSDVAGIDCLDDCSETYTYGTVVMLTAAPDAGAKFKGWSGACTGTDTTCAVTIDQAVYVTAEFSSAFPWSAFMPAIIMNSQAQP